MMHANAVSKKLKTKKWYVPYLAIFFGFFIFGRAYGLLDYSIISLFAFTVVVILSKKKIVKVHNIPILLFQLVCLLSLLSLISASSHLYNLTPMVPEFILKPIRVIVVWALLFIIFYYGEITYKNLNSAIILIILVHAMVIFVQLYLHWFHGVFYFLMPSYISNVDIARKIGLSTGFPSAGLLLVWGIHILLYAGHKTNGFYLKLFFMVIAIFFTSRTALLISLITIPFHLFYKRMLIRFALLLSCLLTICGLIIVFYASDILPFIERTTTKMVTNIINYQKTGSFHDHSTANLFGPQHVYFPNALSGWLIGNSRDFQTGFQNSDISYIRILNGTGLPALLIYLMIIITQFLFLIKTLKHNQKAQIKWICIFIGFFIMSFKGHYFLSRIIGDFITIYFIYFIVEKSRRAQKPIEVLK